MIRRNVDISVTPSYIPTFLEQIKNTARDGNFKDATEIVKFNKFSLFNKLFQTPKLVLIVCMVRKRGNIV